MSAFSVTNAFQGHACNCIGPQNGDPVCPCMMRSVRVVDDRYVKVDDLGPVSRKPRPETREQEIARLEKRLEELRRVA